MPWKGHGDASYCGGPLGPLLVSSALWLKSTGERTGGKDCHLRSIPCLPNDCGGSDRVTKKSLAALPSGYCPAPSSASPGDMGMTHVWESCSEQLGHLCHSRRHPPPSAGHQVSVAPPRLAVGGRSRAWPLCAVCWSHSHVAGPSPPAVAEPCGL